MLILIFFTSKSDTYLTFGVELNSKKTDNFHELEYKKLKISSESGFNSSQFGPDKSGVELSLGYEYNIRVFKKTKKVNFYIGLGTNPYFSSYNISPVISTDNGYSVNELGLGLNLVPRMKFRLHKKIGFEIKMQTEILNVERSIINSGNPIIPISERKSVFNNFSNINTGDRIYSRMSFGINYKI